MYVTRFIFYQLVERDNRHSFTRCFQLLSLRNSQINTTELYLYITLHPCTCCYRNEQRFPLLLETNNAFRVVTQTYFNRFLCSQSLHGSFRNKKEFNILKYIKVYTATRWTIRHSLMLLWFADLMNITEEVTIHRPNVSTLLSCAFIRGDLNAATRKG